MILPAAKMCLSNKINWKTRINATVFCDAIIIIIIILVYLQCLWLVRLFSMTQLERPSSADFVSRLFKLDFFFFFLVMFFLPIGVNISASVVAA